MYTSHRALASKLVGSVFLHHGKANNHRYEWLQMETAPLLEVTERKYLAVMMGSSQWGFWTKSDDPVWEGIHVVRWNMDFYDGYPNVGDPN